MLPFVPACLRAFVPAAPCALSAFPPPHFAGAAALTAHFPDSLRVGFAFFAPSRSIPPGAADNAVFGGEGPIRIDSKSFAVDTERFPVNTKRFPVNTERFPVNMEPIPVNTE